MSKKKTRRRVQPHPTPRQQSFSLGRYYRHNRAQILKTLTYVFGGIAAIAAIWAAYSFIVNREVTLTKEQYMTLARQDFLLGNYEQSVLNYHRAQNQDPNDKILQREYFLAKSRDAMSSGSPVDVVLSASQQLMMDDPNSLIGKISLAQVHEIRGDVNGMHNFATQAREQARQIGDTVAILASDVVLATYYRSIERQDSAFYAGREALECARAINQPFYIALASAGMGFAAMRIDSLDAAHAIFEELLSYTGESDVSYREVANAGLADYFHRVKNFDSTQIVLNRLNHVINSMNTDGTAAYACHVYGRLLRDTGRLDSAIVFLDRSLQIWSTLQSSTDVIDNLNDLARTYRLKDDYFNARKNFMAAGTLADKYQYPGKNLYTADLNLVFLKNLKPAQYVEAGDEGKAWAERYSGR